MHIIAHQSAILLNKLVAQFYIMGVKLIYMCAGCFERCIKKEEEQPTMTLAMIFYPIYLIHCY